MPYTSLENLVAKFGTRHLVNLTDRDEEPTGEINAAILAAAIEDAAALIDGYLAGRFQLPLAVVPPLVESLAEKIVIKELHVYGAPQDVNEDYERALKMLQKINEGTIKLPVAEVSQEPAQTGSNGVKTTDRPRPFTASNLSGFV